MGHLPGSVEMIFSFCFLFVFSFLRATTTSTGPMACKRIHGYTPSPSSSPSALLGGLDLAITPTTATSSSSSASPFSPELSYKCRVKDLLYRKTKVTGPSDPRVKLTFAQKVDLFEAVSSFSLHQVTNVLNDILLECDEGSKLNLDYSVNDAFCARSPLQKAAILGRPDFIKALLDAGATPNYTESTDGNTAAHLTLQYFRSETEIVGQLIEAGADLMIQNDAGQTCFMFACRLCETEVIMMIISRSHDLQKLVTIQDENGFNAFHFLGDSICVDHEKIVSAICQKLSDRSILSVGTPNYLGVTEDKENYLNIQPHLPLASPLEHAIQLGRGKLAVALLKNGSIPYSRAALAFTCSSSSTNKSKALARYEFMCACTKLYEQCREEIITLGMHVYNPRMAHLHGPLKDVFPMILPYMRYWTRLPLLISEHF